MRKFNNDFTVIVDKEVLLKTLRSNLIKHKENFKIAIEGWKQESINKLIETKNLLENNKIPRILAIIDSPPQDMSKDYEQAIQMLEFHSENTMPLDQQQFSAFVQDKWDWSSNWNSSNSKYLGM